jgi:hypothetical protein
MGCRFEAACDSAFLPVGYPAGKHRTTLAARSVNRDMSYHPSHRRPPRQERWPDATPDRAWPAYVGADGYRDAQAWGAAETRGGYDARGDYDGRGDYDARWDGQAGYGTPAGSYPPAYDDYRGTSGYPAATDGLGGSPYAFDAGDGFDGRAASYGPGGYRTLAEEYGNRGGAIAYGTREEYAQAWDGGRSPDGYADPDGYAGPDGYARPDGYADPDGYA